MTELTPSLTPKQVFCAVNLLWAGDYATCLFPGTYCSHTASMATKNSTYLESPYLQIPGSVTKKVYSWTEKLEESWSQDESTSCVVLRERGLHLSDFDTNASFCPTKSPPPLLNSFNLFLQWFITLSIFSHYTSKIELDIFYGEREGVAGVGGERDNEWEHKIYGKNKIQVTSHSTFSLLPNNNIT